jgi:hypothetical protein
MRSTIVAAALLLLCSQTANADYDPLNFVQMLGIADTIVAGEITKLNPTSFELRVDDLLVGRGAVGDTIVVRRFQNWMCAKREPAYATGQRVLLLLEKTADPALPFSIPSGGGEGESFIVNADVWVRFDCPGGHLVGQRYVVPYDTLRAAIIDFRANYRVKAFFGEFGPDARLLDHIETIPNPPPPADLRGFRKRTPLGGRPAAPEPFAARSVIHKYLHDVIVAERKKIIEAHRNAVAVGISVGESS